MKNFLYILLVLVVAVSTIAVEPTVEDEDWNELEEYETQQIDGRGLILNSQAKKAVRNMLEQLPCGWPELGIPPLAPYTNRNLEIHIAESVVDSLLQFIRFRFDGLDAMKVNKLKVSYTFKKQVKFDFSYRELKVTARSFNTNTLIDFMRQLGISLQYEGSGPLEFALENLSIRGQFKYKMPFMFGSIRIYKFEAVVGLGGVRSNIGGILGNGALNQLINDQIEYAIPAFINGYQHEISEKIEEAVVPRVNRMLAGKKIWSLLGMIGQKKPACHPDPVPW